MAVVERNYFIRLNGRKVCLEQEECVTVMYRLVKQNKIGECLQTIRELVTEEGFPISSAFKQVFAILEYCASKAIVLKTEENSEDNEFFENLYWLYNTFTFRREKLWIRREFFRAFARKITMLHPCSQEAIQPEGYSAMREKWIIDIILEYTERTNKWKAQIDFNAEQKRLQAEYNNAVEDFFYEKEK